MRVSKPPTPSRLAAPVATAIRDRFAAYRQRHLELSAEAKRWFAERDYVAQRRGSVERLRLYRGAVDEAEATIRLQLGERARDRLVWVSAKAVYSALISERQDWDLAETFFNGVTRRIFDTVGVDPLVEYVASDFDAPPTEPDRLAYLRFAGAPLEELTSRALDRVEVGAPIRNVERDCALIDARVGELLIARGEAQPYAYEVIAAPFFQGRTAYIVGRLVMKAGRVIPLLLAVRNDGEAGPYVDAVLTDESDVSMVFSFTRSYFFVEVSRPYDVMRFIRSLIPKKRIAEIYIAIGEPKQGKTELYRAIMDHIEDSQDIFDYAPGTPGLVMVVFTMPGIDVVFKVIRDKFPPQKDMSPDHVRERYRWVYEHDRAGRLVDAQEFEHLAFPLAQFSPELLAELRSECANTVHIEGDRVIIELAYVERQLEPLNLFVRQRSQAEAEDALREWGSAIGDLAACNIFPGDLLLKNFGVTRHGRVALYDYDELAALADMRFREIPESDDDEDEMRAEPWFAVDPHDVFPEEFPRFLGLPRRLRPALLASCDHVFRPAWWRSMQEKVEAGTAHEFPAYREQCRLGPG